MVAILGVAAVVPAAEVSTPPSRAAGGTWLPGVSIH